MVKKKADRAAQLWPGYVQFFGIHSTKAACLSRSPETKKNKGERKEAI